MPLPWPFRRSQQPSAPAGVPAAGPAADAAGPPALIGRPGWRDLPPVQRTLDEPPLVAPPAPFRDGLAGSQRTEPMLRRLAHGRSDSAPAGIVRGLATVSRSAAAGQPSSAAQPGLALRLSQAARGARHWLQRRTGPVAPREADIADDVAHSTGSQAVAPPAAETIQQAGVDEQASGPATPQGSPASPARPPREGAQALQREVARPTPKLTSVAPESLALLRRAARQGPAQASLPAVPSSQSGADGPKPPATPAGTPRTPSIQRVVGPNRRVRLGPPVGRQEMPGSLQRSADPAGQAAPDEPPDTSAPPAAGPGSTGAQLPAMTGSTPTADGPLGQPLVLRRTTRLPPAQSDDQPPRAGQPTSASAPAADDAPAEAGQPTGSQPELIAPASAVSDTQLPPLNLATTGAAGTTPAAQPIAQRLVFAHRPARPSPAQPTRPLATDRAVGPSRPVLRPSLAADPQLQRSTGPAPLIGNRSLDAGTQPGDTGPARDRRAPESRAGGAPGFEVIGSPEFKASGLHLARAGRAAEPSAGTPAMPTAHLQRSHPTTPARLSRAAPGASPVSPVPGQQLVLASRPAVAAIPTVDQAGAALAASGSPTVARTAEGSSGTSGDSGAAGRLAGGQAQPVVQAQAGEAVEAGPEPAAAEGGAAGSPGSMGERELEDLLRKLYPKLRIALSRELLVARERSGLLTDLH